MSSSSTSTIHSKVRQLLSSLSLLPPSLSPEQAKALVDKTVRSLNQGGGLRNEWEDVEKELNSIVQKHRILSLADELAEALEIETDKLVAMKVRESKNPKYDREAEIKVENLPAHLAFLLALSNRPDANTHLAASNLLRQSHIKPQTDRELWDEIFAEDPSSDQDDEEEWVEPDFGSEGSDFSSSETSSSRGRGRYEDDEAPKRRPSSSSFASRLPLKPPAPAVIVRDSPRPWSDPRFFLEDETDYSNSHGWQEMLKLPSMPRFIDVQANDEARVTLPDRRRYIRETDAIREVLLALSGRPGVVFEFEEDRCATIPNINLLHLSPDSTESLLTDFATISTTLLHLRTFTQSALSQPNLTHSSLTSSSFPTLQAFADGVQNLVWEFDRWLAEREQTIIFALTSSTRPQTITILSFLHLLKPLTPTFTHLSSLIRILPSSPSSVHPSVLAIKILNLLHRSLVSHRSIGETQIASDLERIFVKAMEPMWREVGRWLKEGMRMDEGDGFGLKEESFIVRSAEEEVGDGADFWRKGYRLRREVDGEVLVPECLGVGMAEEILAAGKAVGLLRALGLKAGFGGAQEEQEEDEEELDARTRRNKSSWKSFSEVVGIEDGFPKPFSPSSAAVGTTSIRLFDAPPPLSPPPAPPPRRSPLESVFTTPPLHPPPFEPTTDISLALSDHLSPLLLLLQYKLHRVLIEECGLMEHLDAIEGLFLMRKGECIGDWSEEIWEKMDSGRPWNDYYVLNSTFAEAVDGEQSGWIDPSLVRFWTKLGERNSKGLSSRSVKALESLSVSYQVPSPLQFLFTPETMAVRSSIFVFLLQLRRARNLMSRISLIKRDEWQGVKDGMETKAFYGLRKRLGWVVSVFWDFIMTNVLHVQSMKFREKLAATGSLDDMIPLHEHHISRLQDLCLLNERTSPLFKTVITIFDLCILFSDVFTAFTTDASGINLADLSRRSILPPRSAPNRSSSSRRKRSWRSRKRAQHDAEDDSDLDDLEEAGNGIEGDGSEGSRSWTMNQQTTMGSISFVEEPFLGRVERMATELTSLVRFLQLGVDTLAKTTAPPTSREGSKEVDGRLKRTMEMGDLRETWEVLSFALEGYS